MFKKIILVGGALTLALTAPVGIAANPEIVTICHVTISGDLPKYLIIRVPASEVPAHMRNHGDYVVDFHMDHGYGRGFQLMDIEEGSTCAPTATPS